MLKLRTFDKKDIENIDLDFVIEKQHKDAFVAPDQHVDTVGCFGLWVCFGIPFFKMLPRNLWPHPKG